MDADYNMWTPAFKDFGAKGYAALMKELSCFRTKLVNTPIQVLHPMLPVAQEPVV
jgi:hypothetical protein